MDIWEPKLKFTCFLRQGYEVIGEQRHPVLLPSGGGEGSARDETLELCRASLVHLFFFKFNVFQNLMQYCTCLLEKEEKISGA